MPTETGLGSRSCRPARQAGRTSLPTNLIGPSRPVALLELLARAAVARIVAADLRPGAHRLARPAAVLAVPAGSARRDWFRAGGSPALGDVASRRVGVGLGRHRDAEDG